MTRIAALYDIHGNLPALDAALAAAAAAEAEIIVVGGDMALGPMPAETLDRLLALGSRARFVRGNCDRLIVSAMDGNPLDGLPASVHDTITWTAAQLDERHRALLAGLPEAVVERVPTLGEVLFCHATPRSDEELVTRLTPAERLRPMLSGIMQRVVVCGHTHMQYDREVDGMRLINAGSVGMPYGEPGAYWLLLDTEATLMRTAYDFEHAAELVRRTAYPQPAEFAARHVLKPPTEREMLRVLEPAFISTGTDQR